MTSSYGTLRSKSSEQVPVYTGSVSSSLSKNSTVNLSKIFDSQYWSASINSAEPDQFPMPTSCDSQSCPAALVSILFVATFIDQFRNLATVIGVAPAVNETDAYCPFFTAIYSFPPFVIA